MTKKETKLSLVNGIFFIFCLIYYFVVVQRKLAERAPAGYLFV